MQKYELIVELEAVKKSNDYQNKRYKPLMLSSFLLYAHFLPE